MSALDLPARTEVTIRPGGRCDRCAGGECGDCYVAALIAGAP